MQLHLIPHLLPELLQLSLGPTDPRPMHQGAPPRKEGLLVCGQPAIGSSRRPPSLCQNSKGSQGSQCNFLRRFSRR